MKLPVFFFSILIFQFAGFNCFSKNRNSAENDPVIKNSSHNQIEETVGVNEPGSFKDTVYFETQSLYSITGSAIGLNSMETFDLDHDGIMELICSASMSMSGRGDYWYIMNYDSLRKEYCVVWSSDIFLDWKQITALEVYDIGNDGKYEVVIGLIDGSVMIVDALSKLQKVVRIVNYEILSIDYADADNDSVMDLIVSTRNETHILDALTLKPKIRINKSSPVVRVGNIDRNPQNEVVLSSGFVYRIENNTATLLSEFSGESLRGKLELEDVDGDSIAEIIFAHEWYTIDIIDADLTDSKKSFKAKSNIAELKVIDVDNDGVKELIYGDAQWGYVHCLNAKTGEEIWSVKNPDSGVTNIEVSDLDNDGFKELVWSGGHNSTGVDHLFVYDINNMKLKWKSRYIFGPFFVIKKGDVNGDGIDDIVGVTSIGDGDSGKKIIVVTDGLTNRIIWESSDNLLDDHLIDDILIEDINTDGYADIIVPDNWSGTSFITFSGKDFSMTRTRSLYPVEEIDALASGDYNNDGVREVYAANGAVLYIVNPLKWKYIRSILLPIRGDGTNRMYMKCDDVTGDKKEEVVICCKNIIIVNMQDFSTSLIAENDFLSIDLFDYNNDGITDIVGSTQNGEIRILDGVTKKYIAVLKPENSSIAAVKAVRYKGFVVFVYSCDGRLNYYISENQRIVGQYIDNDFLNRRGLELYTVNDEVRVVYGSNTSVKLINADYFSCTSLAIAIEKNEVSCNLSDGAIKLDVDYGMQPYYIKWSNDSVNNEITNLKAGTYTVSVSDESGCVKKRTIDLPSAYLEIEASVTNQNCIHKGEIELTVIHSNDPYSIKWSNWADSLKNTNLKAGNYWVEIVDSKNCKYNEFFIVYGDTIGMKPYIKNASCFGKSDGNIYVQPVNYYGSFNYKWDNGQTRESIYDLSAGTYTLHVTDTYGCEKDLQFEVKQPDDITYSIVTVSDVDSTNETEGKVLIDQIKGGKPPYTVFWPEFKLTSFTVDSLSVGNYEFVVSDANRCSVRDTAVIDLSTVGVDLLNDVEFKIYPNPTSSYVTVQLDYYEPNQRIVLVEMTGRIVKEQPATLGPNQVDVSMVKRGNYLLGIRYDNLFHFKKLSIK